MNEIRIGTKDSMTYLKEILENRDTEIIISARGKHIVRAIDVSMMCSKKWDNFKIEKVGIGTEEKNDKYKNKGYYSYITIKASKDKKLKVKQNGEI